jgi:CheY-like chemotaxis protein
MTSTRSTYQPPIAMATTQSDATNGDQPLPAVIILIVEDEETLRDGLVDLLQLHATEYDLTLLTAANGLEALDVMQQYTPDLIVTDINMPVMDGYTFLQTVRQKPEWVHIPVIFLTARSSDEAIMEGRFSGAELYIVKPFDADDVADLIQAQLAVTRSRRNQRRESAETKRRHILRTLQHEFRTPLNFVTAYFEILSDSLLTDEAPETTIEYLKGIQIGTARLSSLVRDLILVIDLHSGKCRQTWQQQATVIDDIDTILREVGTLYAKQAAAKQIALEYDVADALKPIWGVRTFIFDCIKYLVDNAIKFTPTQDDRGPIILTTVNDQDHVRISVADHGVGIPNAAIPLLFDLFYQHDRATYEQQGSGAGLTIVKGLVELHGGEVNVQSRLDHGSVFTLSFPIFDSTSATASPIADHAAAETATLLVIEDEPSLLEGLRDLLEGATGQRHVYRVLTAGNGVDGLRILAKHQVDLILCDIVMPHMDGYEFLEQVHRNPDWTTIPVIFLSARNEQGDIKYGRQLGVDEYLTKPYDVDELLGVTKARLNRHFAVEQVEDKEFQHLRRSILDLLSPQFSSQLDTVQSHSELLLQSVQSAETITELVESLVAIDTSSDMLVDLVSDFTMLVELRTGVAQHTFNQRAQIIQDIGSLIAEACSAPQLSAENTTIHLTTSIAHNLPAVHGDPRLLSLLVIRLVTIFIQQSKSLENNAIEIAAFARDGNVIVEVSGNERVFTEAELGLIRALFAESDQTLLHESPIGSALVLVAELTRLHGGHVSLCTIPEQRVSIAVALPATDIKST